MNWLVLARALHVVSVVLWIGGVGFATSVLLPGISASVAAAQRFASFRAFESRFAWIARALVVIVGASGFYMLVGLHLGAAMVLPRYWWLHAMIGLWLLFAAILFIAEPLFLHRWMEQRHAAAPEKYFRRLQIMHWVLLGLALVTVCGAVEGAHGGL